MMQSVFQNKVCWVTGASSGIGEALTYALHNRGARLIISSRRRKVLQKVKLSCVHNSSPVHILPLDLSEPSTLKEKAEQALQVYGSVDYLFNNGGISQRSPAIDTEMDVLRRLMEVNFFGTVALTKAVLPAMMARRQGHIVVTSSMMGKISTRGRSGYAASKHALHGWFDSLRQEMHHHNIKVTLVCPGYIKTNITVNALQANGSPYGKMSNGQKHGMSPEHCANKMLLGIKKNKQEMYIGGKEVLGIYLKRLAPRMLNMVLRNMEVM